MKTWMAVWIAVPLMLLAGGAEAQGRDRPSLLVAPWAGPAPNMAAEITERVLSGIDRLGHFDRVDWDGLVDSSRLTRHMSESSREALGCLQGRQMAGYEGIDYVFCGSVTATPDGFLMELSLHDMKASETIEFSPLVTKDQESLVEHALTQLREWRGAPMFNRTIAPPVTFLAGLLLGASVSAGAWPVGQLEQAREPSVAGIGGVFLRAGNPEELQAWYQRHLGLEPHPEGIHFLWREPDEPNRIDRTVWSLFPSDTDYFGSSGQQCMVNYIVRDLDLVLSRLAEGGIHPVKDVEEYPYGRFAWVLDGEGNRIELWEPPAGEG